MLKREDMKILMLLLKKKARGITINTAHVEYETEKTPLRSRRLSWTR